MAMRSIATVICPLTGKPVTVQECYECENYIKRDLKLLYCKASKTPLRVKMRGKY